MWFYKKSEFKEEDIPENIIGFVYQINNKINGMVYIGKKLFKFTRTKRVKGRKRKTKIASDWKTYYGSNKKLNEDVKKYGEDKFHREILHLCSTKGICSYLETKEILIRDALISDDYYNQWISAKISRSHLGDLNGFKKN